MRFSVGLTLSCLLISHYFIKANAAVIQEKWRFISITTTNPCALDLNAISESLNTLQKSLNKNNIFQARHDYNYTQEAAQRAEASCCLVSSDTSHHLQSIKVLSEQINTLLSAITTKIQDSGYLLRIVSSMELEQLQTSSILHLDACLASSLPLSIMDTYKNHSNRIQQAFAKFKATSLLL